MHYYEYFQWLCKCAGVDEPTAYKGCGLNRSSVSRWRSAMIEGREVQPSGKAAAGISKYFHIPAEYVFSMTDIFGLSPTDYVLMGNLYSGERNKRGIKIDRAVDGEIVTVDELTAFEENGTPLSETQLTVICGLIGADPIYIFSAWKNNLWPSKNHSADVTNSESKNFDLSARIAALDDHGREAILALLACEEARMAREDEKSYEEPKKVVKLIRHYFSSPAAGVGGMEAGEDYEDIPLPDDAPKNADYCLTVSGDSMEPYIADGSMVYVLKDARLDDFDVGVFLVDGVAYIKQYCRGYGGEQYLLSANPKREDANITIHADGNQRFEYKGKVILKKKLPHPVYG